MNPLLIWLQLLAAVVLIVIAGTRLSGDADAVSARTGLSRSWIGVLLLATVTSLPELVTGVTAAYTGVPDIAVGGILGSCVFNLTILVLLDVITHRSGRRQSIYLRVTGGHSISAAFGLTLIAVTGFGTLTAWRGLPLAIGSVGLYSPAILLLYLFAMRQIFLSESGGQAAPPPPSREVSHRGNRALYLSMGFAIAIVVGTGIWLPSIGEGIADVMGWKDSFVGTIFIALATSLPEVVVTLAALRIGAADMAVGNLLGSNVFNIAILAVEDLVYVQGSLLSDASLIHAVSAFTAIAMTGLVIGAIASRRAPSIARVVSLPSVLIIGLYALNFYVLFVGG